MPGATTEYGWRYADVDASERFTDPNGKPYTRERAEQIARIPGVQLIARDVSPTRVMSVRT